MFEIMLDQELINVIAYLLEIDCNIDLDLLYYIEHWVSKNRFDIVELLFRMYKGDFDQEWLDNLLSNLEKYSEDIVQLLIDNGADINKYGKKLYRKAKQNKNYELAKYIKNFLDD